MQLPETQAEYPKRSDISRTIGQVSGRFSHWSVIGVLSNLKGIKVDHWDDIDVLITKTGLRITVFVSQLIFVMYQS